MRLDEIEVLSRAAAIEKSYIIDRDTVIISIHDRNADEAELALDNPFIKDVLFLSFDDEESVSTGGMKLQDAHAVLDFIEEHMNEDVALIVHCGGGVSRSAGTAAAIMLILFGDDSAVFDSPRFSPNMHCYRSVLDAAGLGYNDEIVNEREQKQRELWLELARENGLI